MRNIVGRRTLLTLAASLMIVQTGPSMAQGQQASEIITVDGSYHILKSTHMSNPMFDTVTDYTVSQPVSYAGLDLTTQQGMEIFKGRVNVTARNLCGVLDKVSPATWSEERDCVNTATNNAIQNATNALTASLDQKPKVASLH